MSYFQFYQPFTGVVRHLVIINVLMFAGTYVLLGQYDYNPAAQDFDFLGRYALAAFLPGSSHFAPFQIATHMFMHADIMHLAFNMLSLYFFGSMVEMVWGHKRFLMYYLICGVGSYLMQMGTTWYSLTQEGVDPATYNGCSLGASGAVFGIFVAFAYLFPNQIISLMFPPISLKAKYFVPIMAGLELIYGVKGVDSGVAHFAHLGGALVGFITIMFWYRGRWRHMY